MELIRFSDIASKEVVNYGNGKCLGTFSDCDIRFDPHSGKILEVILAGRSKLNIFFSSPPIYSIPWESIVRIGVDTIIVSLEGEKI